MAMTVGFSVNIKYITFIFTFPSACTFTAKAVKVGCASAIKINVILKI